MESSDEDAGAAADASRRTTAREKDEGSREGGSEVEKATGSASLIEITSMSESEGFDNDSVPSPSTLDVNTSTEALLDLIDEIVEGPDAPKRLSLSSENLGSVEICPTISDSTKSSDSTKGSLDLTTPLPDAEPPLLQPLTPSASTSQCENNDNESISQVESENTICSEVDNSNVNKHDVEAVASSCEGSNDNRKSPKLQDVVAPSVEQVSSDPPINIPSSSVSEAEERVSEVSESEECTRTIKYVTSSDSRDNVTVESAESTSSESSVSESAIGRSPLRRRLVRPAPTSLLPPQPLDRRPDCTVSSTEDSNTVNVDTTEQTFSECVVKDVSSSSDAVPSVHGNVKPEEIRNVSEVSVCKAETSVSPPKKIKLIRQKPPLTQKCEVLPVRPVVTENDPGQCQSTSSDSQAVLSLSETPKTSDNLSKVPEELVTEVVEEKGTANIPNTVTETTVQVVPSEIAETVNVQSEDVSQEAHEKLELKEPVEPNPLEKVDKIEEDKKAPTELNVAPSNSSDKLESESKTDNTSHDIIESSNSSNVQQGLSDTKQVPKLTIKLGGKPSMEEMKSPLPKLTIKPLKPPDSEASSAPNEQIPNVTKLNIKPILKPAEKINDTHRKSSSSEISESESSENDESNSTSDQTSASDHCSSDVIPKVTIKLGKPGTESEGKFYTEPNIPKLTIKGLQNMENEEQDSSKLTLVYSQAEDKQQEKVPKLTIKAVSKSESQPLSPKLTIKPLKSLESVSKENLDADLHTIPKITIKSVKMDSEISKTPKKSTCESEHDIPVVTKLHIKPVIKPSEAGISGEHLEEKLPVVSKLNIKPIPKPTDTEINKKDDENVPVISKINIKPIMKPADVSGSSNYTENSIPVVSKLNIKPVVKPAESHTSDSTDEKVPVVSKLNIKPIVKPADECVKTDDNIPVVSKLNIKPVLKHAGNDGNSDELEVKVPVVSKLNIKPILKPKDSEVDSSVEDIPKVTKLNIKPLKNPEEGSSEEKDCDELNTINEQTSVPIVTKLNIKPIVKPEDENTLKDSENQSSETGTSSDDNEIIPVVTKLNIKPIMKRNESEAVTNTAEESIPVITKLNIKPLVKPEESTKSPQSPKREGLRSSDKNTSVPTVTKLNIKPIIKPEEIEPQKNVAENDDKNPPLLMKINMKGKTDSLIIENDPKSDLKNSVSQDVICNNISDTKPEYQPLHINTADKVTANCKSSSSSPWPGTPKQNCFADSKESGKSPKAASPRIERLKIKPVSELQSNEHIQEQAKLDNSATGTNKANDNAKHFSNVSVAETVTTSVSTPLPRPSTQNCTLLKKLLETKKDGLDNRLEDEKVNTNHTPESKESLSALAKAKDLINSEKSDTKIVHSVCNVSGTLEQNKINEQHVESLTKPLEINVSEKVVNQSSGQDSPRIILKINKTDQGASAKIITEDVKNSDIPKLNDISENTQENKEKQVQKKNALNIRKKPITDLPSVTVGKRLRSSRIVEENTPVSKKNVCKRSPTTETSPPTNKETEMSNLESKRLKLGQLLSNKSLTITAIPSKQQISLPKPDVETHQGIRMVNHTIRNNENCSKNGNSKLQTILSNLQVKQAQKLAFKEVEREKIVPDLESNASTGSSDVVEIIPIEASLERRDAGESGDVSAASEETRDPLDTAQESVPAEPPPPAPAPPPAELLTPQPKKRGRPRKLPVSEGAKPPPPPPVVLPVPALEERPQRSLRLNRERPVILVKRRGRGRGRGARSESTTPRPEPESPQVASEAPEEEDPTSSRVKLPRLTEALDRLPCAGAGAPDSPVTHRRRPSTPMRLLAEGPELKVVLENSPLPLMDTSGRGGRPLRGRGSRGGKMGRTPRGRGRGRGGGRGAVYMKETMGIYGRVCGPATTTVQLFEEETCMMDDNATPSKPSHLIDEDSQSSVKSLTNESTVKKSKLDDLFDSSKEWTAADVKEYIWPPPEKQKPDEPGVTYMIAEQVSLFLHARNFCRRYPALKGRTIGGDEREYVIGKGIVAEELKDDEITAVDASNVLDIMLSDFPHKYEEFRCYQRARQLAEAEAEAAAAAEDEEAKKSEPKAEVKVEMKAEVKVEPKPEPSKADLEKTRLEMAKAAIASASEFNARLNLSRRVGSADMQTMTVHVRRPPPTAAPPEHVQPPGGFYPHALLPGQYQHWYRTYTPEQLRYFPLSTVLGAPPRPPSPPPSEEDDDSDSTSSDGSLPPLHPAKRKKLTKTKRSSQTDSNVKEELNASTSNAGDPSQPVELCRVCNLRQEGNRKHSHERFLACATCNAKFHPNCVTLGADTIRRARQYAWQCAECKVCSKCGRKQEPAAGDDNAADGNAADRIAADRNGGDTVACDLCDRGFHIACLGMDRSPPGRWHCSECAICKSCGARDPAGPAGAAGGGPQLTGVPAPPSPAPAAPPAWHHHTKRGPGGHKVYSHSLCTPCARAHRIGRYCPLCDRSIIAPKGAMQLVICKLCDRQHHQECVRGSTTSSVNVLDWTCAECRRGGITSRSAAARAAPRTIATLFMAKRRFNKYAHRQYMASRARPPTQAPPPPPDVSDNSTLDPLTDAADSLAEAPELVDASDSNVDASDSLMDTTDPLVETSDPLVETSDPLETTEGEAETEAEMEAEDPLRGADEAAAAVAALAAHFAD